MHDKPMKNDKPNGVRSSDWLGNKLGIVVRFSAA
jgi:hypothetical protein